MNPLIQFKKTPTLPRPIALALVYFGVLPTAQALLPPPSPDGGYPGQNTAEGDGALFNLTIGMYNTATGLSGASWLTRAVGATRL